MFLYETWNIVYRCLIRKKTNSGFTQWIHKQLRLFMFEQRFHMQTPIMYVYKFIRGSSFHIIDSQMQNVHV